MEGHKLGVGIIAFENYEFLVDIAAEARKVASEVVVYLQEESYDKTSKLSERVIKYVEKLEKMGFITRHVIVDLKNGIQAYRCPWARTLEVNKRNKARLDLQQHGCDYCLILDSDELVKAEDLDYGFNWMAGHPECDASYVTGFHYYKDLKHYIANPEVGFSFIAKSSVPFTFKKFIVEPKLTYEIDFMRQFDTDAIVELAHPKVHHFFMMRSDMAGKWKNGTHIGEEELMDDKIREYALFDGTTHYVEHCLPKIIDTRRFYINTLPEPLVALKASDIAAGYTDAHVDTSMVNVHFTILQGDDEDCTELERWTKERGFNCAGIGTMQKLNLGNILSHDAGKCIWSCVLTHDGMHDGGKDLDWIEHTINGCIMAYPFNKKVVMMTLGDYNAPFFIKNDPTKYKILNDNEILWDDVEDYVGTFK